MKESKVMRIENESLSMKIYIIIICFLYIPFVHKSLQNYNDFVWTVTRLNRYMNYSLAAVGLLIRKPGPHNSRGSVGPLK